MSKRIGRGNGRPMPHPCVEGRLPVVNAVGHGTVWLLRPDWFKFLSGVPAPVRSYKSNSRRPPPCLLFLLFLLLFLRLCTNPFSSFLQAFSFSSSLLFLFFRLFLNTFHSSLLLVDRLRR